jgi:hypothetical protein
MDRATLVESQIEDGEKLIHRLIEDGFPVTVAAWIKESESGSWYLYIASPVVDQDVRFGGYRRLHALMRQMPQPFWLDLFAVKLLETTDSLTEALLTARQRYPVERPVRLGEALLGVRSIDGAYIYPPITLAAK